MRKTLSIAKFEFKIQCKKISGWLVFLFAFIVAMADDFPSAVNLDRLEFLSIPSYFIQRTVAIPGLMLLFGLMFVASNCIRGDSKAGLRDLFMASPISKNNYIFGKLTGGFLYILFIVVLFLAINTLIYAIALPAQASFIQYISAFSTILFCVIIPTCFFVVACSVLISTILDIRIYYLLISVLFIMNALTVGSASNNPFYLITHGDLSKLVWHHPEFPMPTYDSMVMNLVFMLGVGIIAIALIYGKRNFWRNT